MTKKTYRQLKEELDEVMMQLQDPVTDIDAAIVLHAKAKELLAEIEIYLKGVEQKVKEQD